MNVPVFTLPDIQLDNQIREHLTPILASVPKNWGVYYFQQRNTGPNLRKILNDPLYIRSLAMTWYREALHRHTLGTSWTQGDMAWIKAFPPNGIGMEEDDLGYANFIPVADFKQTWETGVLS